ncbi:hypothetical protein SprV_0100504200 [Sparganum proliferum]
MGVGSRRGRRGGRSKSRRIGSTCGCVAVGALGPVMSSMSKYKVRDQMTQQQIPISIPQDSELKIMCKRLEGRVASMRDFPPPSPKCQSRRFLGTITFYRRSLPNRTDTMPPFFSLPSGPGSSFELSAEALATFDKVKVALSDDTLLIHSASDAPVTLMVDVPNFVFDAVLQHHPTGQTGP